MLPYIFDANQTTHEELMRRRALAQQLLESASSGGVANNVGEGLAQFGRALAGRLKLSAADAAIGKQKSAAMRALGMAFGGGEVPMPTAGAAAPPVRPDVISGSAGTDVLAGGGGNGLSWLKYANQGATRNKPLDEKLIKAMGFLPEMGVEMRVFSGGQDAPGKNARRTGSRRHDHGNAAAPVPHGLDHDHDHAAD